MDVTAAQTAQLVLADVVAALAAATVAKESVFRSVVTAEDLDAFQRVADPIAGPVAGVVARPPQRFSGRDSSEQYTVLLEFDVAIRLSTTRAAGEDERVATDEMLRLSECAKAALEADKSRGGRCGAVKVAGRLVRGTDLRGAPRLVSKGRGAFYVATLPVACAWAV